MILRAIFWIGLVAFLMPREPDLGFGPPGAQANAHSRAAMDGSERFLASFRTVALRNLDQVRADLIANGRPL
jgi:hypothetical protein